MTAAEQIRAALDERDAARAALEDRDRMHAAHVQELEAERLRLHAAVRVLTECTEAAACTCHQFAMNSLCPRCYTLAEAARLLGKERG